MSGRESGVSLPVRLRNYLLVGSKVIPASRKGVSECPSADKDSVKAFFKTHKIRWNDPVSLLTVVDFIAAMNN